MNKVKIFSDLYNGIKNDHSIQRYSLGWKDVLASIEALFRKYHKQIEPNSGIQFEDKLVTDAINISSGRLKNELETFARELQISFDTLRQKNESKKLKNILTLLEKQILKEYGTNKYDSYSVDKEYLDKIRQKVSDAKIVDDIFRLIGNNKAKIILVKIANANSIDLEDDDDDYDYNIGYNGIAHF